MTYAEKLLDPRWQKKRLEILQRDGFACRMCQDKETTLHVHHFCYPKSGNPWDSDEMELITYCECCHALATKLDIKRPQDFVVDLVKRKYGNGSIITCLTHNESKFFFVIFIYEDKKIRMDTVIPFNMLGDMNGLVKKWDVLISKYT